MNNKEMLDAIASYRKVEISPERQCRINSEIPKQFSVLWELAYSAGSDSKVPVRCNVDGDITLRHTSSIRSDMLCDKCLDAKYAKVADSHGFDFLVTRRSCASFTLLKCRKDGNIIKVGISNLLRQVTLGCTICRENAVKSALAIKNCNYVKSETVNSVVQVTYTNPSGVVYVRSESGVIRGNFAVEGSHWDQCHALYVIQLKFNNKYYYKIGTANNPESRLTALRLSGESAVFSVSKFDTRHLADKEEKILHRLYKEFRLNKDVPSTFTRGKSTVKAEDGSHKLSGVTEWFSSEIRPHLNARFNMNLTEY